MNLSKVLNVPLLSINFYYSLILLSYASEHSSMLIPKTGTPFIMFYVALNKFKSKIKFW